MTRNETFSKTPEAAPISVPAESDYTLAWWDRALKASMWWKLNAVEAKEAAMLMCGLDPRDASADSEKLATVGEPNAKDFQAILRWFDDEARGGKPRTLKQWLDFSIEKGLKHHSWIDEWLGASAPGADPARTDESKRAEEVRPLQRRQAQDATLLSKLHELGFNPKALPLAPAGKESAAKAAARDALRTWSKDVFKKSWQRLRDAGEIKDL